MIEEATVDREITVTPEQRAAMIAELRAIDPSLDRHKWDAQVNEIVGRHVWEWTRPKWIEVPGPEFAKLCRGES